MILVEAAEQSPTETDWYYLQSRYYDPEIGRFLNADEIEIIGLEADILSTNVYAYCKNYCIGNYDGSGMFSFCDLYKKFNSFLKTLFNKLMDHLKKQIQITKEYRFGCYLCSWEIFEMGYGKNYRVCDEKIYSKEYRFFYSIFRKST